MLKIKSYKTKLVQIFKIIRFVNAIDMVFKGGLEIIYYVDPIDTAFKVVTFMLDNI